MQRKNTNRPPVILSIAGSDNSGGAGIQADIKTAISMGCYAATVVTGVTAQNFKGVKGVFPVDDRILKAQLDTFFEAFSPDAIKIGMIPSASAVEIIANALSDQSCRHIVIDPIISSTSGQSLSGEKNAAIKAAVEQLYPLAEIITPNLPEAEYLSWLIATEKGERITLFRGASECATRLLKHFPKQSFLIKGGHSEGLAVIDRLFLPSNKEQQAKAIEFVAQRVLTKNTHGTGCTLSTAIACGLAQGQPIEEAIKKAKEYVTEALKRGKEYNLTPGNGPLGF